MTGGGTLDAGATTNLIHQVTFELLAPDGSSLQAGDIYTFGIFRNGHHVADTCADFMSIARCSISYTRRGDRERVTREGPRPALQRTGISA